MTVYLTSFKRYHAGDTGPLSLGALPGYSIAVYQPRWWPELPKLDIFDIRDDNGQWVRPRNFIPNNEGTVERDRNDRDHIRRPPDPVLLDHYHDTLLEMYEQRYHLEARGTGQAVELEGVLGGAYFGGDGENDVALCCWCPYDKAAKRQLADYGSFICHSWPVESFLKELGVEVVRDADREQMVSS